MTAVQQVQAQTPAQTQAQAHSEVALARRTVESVLSGSGAPHKLTAANKRGLRTDSSWINKCSTKASSFCCSTLGFASTSAGSDEVASTSAGLRQHLGEVATQYQNGMASRRDMASRSGRAEGAGAAAAVREDAAAAGRLSAKALTHPPPGDYSDATAAVEKANEKHASASATASFSTAPGDEYGTPAASPAAKIKSAEPVVAKTSAKTADVAEAVVAEVDTRFVIDLACPAKALAQLEERKAAGRTRVLGAGEFGHVLAAKDGKDKDAKSQRQSETWCVAGDSVAGREACVKVPYFEAGKNMEARVAGMARGFELVAARQHALKAGCGGKEMAAAAENNLMACHGVLPLRVATGPEVAPAHAAPTTPKGQEKERRLTREGEKFTLTEAGLQRQADEATAAAAAATTAEQKAKAAAAAAAAEQKAEAPHATVPLMVMERLRGESLQEHLDNPGKSSVNLGNRAQVTFKNLAIQIATGLQSLHTSQLDGQKIAHLDIKPENVFYDATTKTYKLVDFDFALPFNARDGVTCVRPSTRGERDEVTGHLKTERVRAHFMRKGVFCGSPRYVAPEIWLRKEAGPCSDIWSLAILLAQLVVPRSHFQKGMPEGFIDDPARGVGEIDGLTPTHGPFYRWLCRGLVASGLLDASNGQATSEDARILKRMFKGMLTLDPASRFSVDDVLAHLRALSD